MPAVITACFSQSRVGSPGFSYSYESGVVAIAGSLRDHGLLEAIRRCHSASGWLYGHTVELGYWSAGEELHLHGFGPPAVGIRLLLSGTGRYSRSTSRLKFQRSRPCGLLRTDTQEVCSFKEGWSLLRPAGGGFGHFNPQGHGIIASVLASRPLRWSTAPRGARGLGHAGKVSAFTGSAPSGESAEGFGCVKSIASRTRSVVKLLMSMESA